MTTDFADQAAVYRRELVAHCYRMTGSPHEAEDLVQETMLRAWRARDSYDSSRASLRTWLYAIATNVCLTALGRGSRRPMPSGIGPAGEDPDQPLRPDLEVLWLQPLPTDPAEQAEQGVSLRLALVAAVHLLPVRQRAVLLLREVLGFSAREVADQLDMTVAAVNSALQRARAAVGPGMAEEVPTYAQQRAVVDRYAAAFERADVAGLVALLAADCVLEMPPVPLWFHGRGPYGGFMQRVFRERGSHWRTRPVAANGQPALAAYCHDGYEYRLHTLQVFTVDATGIIRTDVFADPDVFATFSLPLTLASLDT